MLTAADGLATAPSIGAMLGALGGSIASLAVAIAGAPLWAIALIFAVGLVLGWGLTPSSADFHSAAPHLLGYVLAYLLSLSPWILLVIGGVGVALYLVALIKIGSGVVAWLISGYTMTCGLLALVGVLGDAPALGLARGLGAMIIVLSLASCVYAVFLLGLFVLALVNSPSAAFVRRKQGDAAAPGVLASLLRSFDTCTTCKLHFRGRCDGCGRTIAEINAATGG